MRASRWSPTAPTRSSRTGVSSRAGTKGVGARVAAERAVQAPPPPPRPPPDTRGDNGMNPSRLFILRPVATSLLMAAILLVGIVAYRELPVSALPQVDYPTIQ